MNSSCIECLENKGTNMTQQKIIQAMGRIGRNKIQQEYTIRFNIG